MSDTYLTDDYVWIVVLGALASFMAAFGIGANDVANSLATSVGAKSLTIRQAVIVATFFEFFGALLFGGHVTKTIRKGIADQECFEDNPALLMHGMMCVLFAVAIWLYLATWLSMPVSTTHSCVGAIVGMTWFVKGADCVTWYKEKDDFPYVGGVAGIVLSWVTAPLISLGFATVLFLAVRTFVLRSENSYKRAYIFYPVIVGITFVVCTLFIIFKAGKGLKFADDLGDTEGEQNVNALLIALAVGVFVALAMIPTVLPWIRKRIDAAMNAEGDAAASELEKGGEPKKGAGATAAKMISDSNAEAASKAAAVQPTELTSESTESVSKSTSVFGKMLNSVKESLDRDPHALLDENETTAAVHDNGEVFDPKTEMFFKYVQVFTCCCDSFAHGANDVANSIGPFAAIYMIYKSGEVSKKQELGDDAYWILGLGGIGIVVGLALYGYKIMQVLGTKMAKVTPSRGFAIELGAVAVIIMGTRMGIPLSTTHCQVGATVGVGLAEGRRGVDYSTLLVVVVGWVATLVVAGFTAGIFASLGSFSPSAYGPAFDGMIVTQPGE